MSAKLSIKKILLFSLGLGLAAGLLVLIVAAISTKNHRNCTGVEVLLKGNGEQHFLSKQDVLAIIAPPALTALKGKPLAAFDLKAMEQQLQRNQWVDQAELFFDNNGMLKVVVKERWPVARVFTTGENSFYIDSSGRRLALNSRMLVRLPVFTDFPSDKEVLHGADSVLMRQVKELGAFIQADSFWTAQVAQVHITPQRQFELIPVVGRHMVLLGDGTDYAQKFHRLLLFYQQVAAVAGMDRYSVINVQFAGQVVATRGAFAGKIDSLQAIKNIREMIEASHEMVNDTVSTIVDNNIVSNPSAAPTLTILKDRQRNAALPDTFQAKPASTTPTKTPAAKKPVTRTPKAVMKKPVAQHPVNNRNN